jgi:hypothetical protein
MNNIKSLQEFVKVNEEDDLNEVFESNVNESSKEIPKEEDLITNIGKYGARILRVDGKFAYYLDSHAHEQSCKLADLTLNNLDDDGEDDGYYEDDVNNWICKNPHK